MSYLIMYNGYIKDGGNDYEDYRYIKYRKKNTFI